jgi:four helix bundle protein
MTNDQINQKGVREKYNLEDRTTMFAEEIIKFAKEIPNSPENLPIKSQLIRSGTSIGANYCEADEDESKKDFIHKIGICKKETRETKYWLRLIAVANPQLKEVARRLWKEAHEFNLIFAAIIRNAKSKTDEHR